MKSIIVIALVVLLGAAGFAVFSKSDSSDMAKGESRQSQQAGSQFEAVAQKLANGSQIIDVRTPEEFAAGHIKEAVNIPLQDIQQGTMPTGLKEKTLYVYCRSGNRSAQAKELLAKAGYQDIVDLGAMTSVQEMGGTIVKS